MHFINEWQNFNTDNMILKAKEAPLYFANR